MTDILFIGDSHIFFNYSDGSTDVNYFVDITLNKIRKYQEKLTYQFEEFQSEHHMKRYIFDTNGDTNLIEFINQHNCEYVLLSIGEIDVRFHLKKRMSFDTDVIEKIIHNYSNFLRKIKKKVIIQSVLPPGNDNTNEFTKDLNSRIFITKILNDDFLKICKEFDYLYFDLYSHYQVNGLLDLGKSSGVHIQKNFQKVNLDLLKQLLNK